MGPHGAVHFIAIGGMLSVLGTASAAGLPLSERRQFVQETQTTSSASEARRDPSAHPIAELRRLSGLTWDQLARLLGVSRRTLHFWVSGKPMTPINEERLARLLLVVQRLDQGSSAETRALLFSDAHGELLFDLLSEGRYEDALGRAGRPVTPSERPELRPLSQEALAARSLPKVQTLVDARQDSVHSREGRSRPGKGLRVKT
jgi:DNA-binding transcriptional regulator YiaG